MPYCASGARSYLNELSYCYFRELRCAVLRTDFLNMEMEAIRKFTVRGHAGTSCSSVKKEIQENRKIQLIQYCP